MNIDSDGLTFVLCFDIWWNSQCSLKKHVDLVWNLIHVNKATFNVHQRYVSSPAAHSYVISEGNISWLQTQSK